MNMHNKLQMAEAVVFFREREICKQMLYPEFEALLDGVVDLPEFADRQVRAVFVLIGAGLQVRAAVFFHLDFDEDGRPDPGWNIPLRHMAERTGRGPDLGAGPIRLACRSQCPVSWHQMHLWDPEQGDLACLRDTIRHNALGLLIEDSLPPLTAERLQLAAEQRWHAPPAQRQLAGQVDQEQRQKAAQLIRQQRLRIAELEQQRDALLGELKAVRAALAGEECSNAGLKQHVQQQRDEFQRLRSEMAEQIRTLERDGQEELELLREQFDSVLQAKVASALAESREQLAIRDVELAYRNELDAQLQAEVERLRAENAALRELGDEGRLAQLAELGVKFVVFHPGAGHLTIPAAELARYQAEPLAYVAARCQLPEALYRAWLEHYQNPSCAWPDCAEAVPRIEQADRFVAGASDRCSLHQEQAGA